VRIKKKPSTLNRSVPKKRKKINNLAAPLRLQEKCDITVSWENFLFASCQCRVSGKSEMQGCGITVAKLFKLNIFIY
jgi:hypothetical protein